MLLNPEQQRAVENDGNCLIVACPGSGKTRLLVSKTARLLRRDPSARIILVSFTRDSVIELRSRIAHELQAKIPKNCVVSTFHSLALNQLRRSLKVNESLPRLVTGDVQMAYLLRAVRAHNDGSYDQETACALIEANRAALDYIPEADSVIGRMIAEYERQLSRHRSMDMSDILTRVVRGLFDGSVAPFAADYLMIDEFQDTDEVQYQWLLCHHSAGSRVTAVGDDDQSIYGFRRALGCAGMRRFAEETGAETIFLGTNYRCHDEILRTGELLIEACVNRIEKTLHAARGKGGIVELAALDEASDEAEFVTLDIQRTIMERRIAPLSYGKLAVLARNNHQLDLLEANLSSANVPYYRTTKSFWESYPVNIFLHFLDSFSKDDDNSGIDLFLEFILNNAADFEELHRQAGIQMHHLITQQITLDYSRLTKVNRERLRSFINFLSDWKQRLKSPDERIHSEFIAVIATWIEEMTSRKSRSIGLAASSIEKSFTGTISDRVSRIREQAFQNSKKNLDRSGVFLTTMHGSKGLEFDCVWIIGVNHNIIPSEKSDIEEERRLLYVASTRAKDQLTITSGGVPSPFFLDLEVLLQDNSRDDESCAPSNFNLA